MMDGEDNQQEGFGSLGWYFIGRQAERGRQSFNQLVDAVTRPAPPSVADVQSLVTENQSLVERVDTLLQENERLRQQYALLASDHRALRDWAREAETEIAEHKQTSLNLAGTVNGQAVEIADLTELIEQLQKK
jgi:hypothetical protein